MEKFTNVAFEILDKNAIYNILKFMEPVDILSLCSINKKFRNICEDRDIFRQLLKDIYPQFNVCGDPKEHFFKITKGVGTLYEIETFRRQTSFYLQHAGLNTEYTLFIRKLAENVSNLDLIWTNLPDQDQNKLIVTVKNIKVDRNYQNNNAQQRLGARLMEMKRQYTENDQEIPNVGKKIGGVMKTDEKRALTHYPGSVRLLILGNKCETPIELWTIFKLAKTSFISDPNFDSRGYTFVNFEDALNFFEENEGLGNNANALMQEDHYYESNDIVYYIYKIKYP